MHLLICLALVSIYITVILWPFIKKRSPSDQTSRNMSVNFIPKKETIYDNIVSLDLEYDLGQISKEELDKSLLILKHEAAEIMERYEYDVDTLDLYNDELEKAIKLARNADVNQVTPT